MRNHNSQAASTKRRSSFKEDTNNKKEYHQFHIEFACGYLENILVDTHNRLRLLYSAADFTRDRDYLSKRLKNEGMKFITHALPTLITGLLGWLEEGNASFPQFKLVRGTNYPRFLNRMFDIVMNEQRYDVESQARAFDSIYNLSSAFKKLRGEPDENLLQQQFGEFLAVDAMLGELNFDSPDLSPIIDSIATQWNAFAADLSIDDRECIPRPGPGAVVGGIKKSMRYAPHRWFKEVDSIFPYQEWFFSHPWDAVDQSRKFLRLLKKPYTPHSEWLAVPKTYLKWRGICKGANEVQFLQQALRRQLYAAIERKLSNGIPIRDQSVHQIRALKSSIDREDATIDESEASDRIARELIWRMTRETPEYRAALMVVSPKYVTPPPYYHGKESLISTYKFAPMGSAICFPIMSLVHYFIVRAIILIHWPDRSFKVLQDLCNRVSVYGDDIILPSETVPLVYTWLPRFGMKINQSKSYVKSHFRESCGCHAYKGYDVTPVYIKYTEFSSIKEGRAKALASLFAAEELLFHKGWLSTAEFLRSRIEAKWGSFPYVSNLTALVGYRRSPSSDQLTDFSLLPRKRTSRRWDRQLQSFKYRLEVWDTVKETGVIQSESEKYLRFHCLAPKKAVSFRWRGKKVSTPFSLDEWVGRMDDETTAFQTKWFPMYSSALTGHELKLDQIGCKP